jgi:NAD(P)-dependent dehydrogenase (short-subunit alcohol dehydrogenase family)
VPDTIREARAPSAESNGSAPGRGRLAGRRVLVVGGGQQTFDAANDPIGNGRAISVLCAREGAAVAVADLNRKSADDTITRIAEDGGRGFAVEADGSQEADVLRLFDEAHAGLGGIDGMVLNVGIAIGGLGLARVDVAEWDRTLAVNLRGPMLCCRTGLDRLDRGSAIVFISSVAGLRSGSQLPAYDASKAALSGLMRHVAREAARRGIRANMICPGLVDTPLGRRTSAARKSRNSAEIPFGRMATGWEIAYAALFLISDESVYITAQTLCVDGGLSGM